MISYGKTAYWSEKKLISFAGDKIIIIIIIIHRTIAFAQNEASVLFRFSRVDPASRISIESEISSDETCRGSRAQTPATRFPADIPVHVIPAPSTLLGPISVMNIYLPTAIAIFLYRTENMYWPYYIFPTSLPTARPTIRDGSMYHRKL